MWSQEDGCLHQKGSSETMEQRRRHRDIQDRGSKSPPTPGRPTKRGQAKKTRRLPRSKNECPQVLTTQDTRRYIGMTYIVSQAPTSPPRRSRVTHMILPSINKCEHLETPVHLVSNTTYKSHVPICISYLIDDGRRIIDKYQGSLRSSSVEH